MPKLEDQLETVIDALKSKKRNTKLLGTTSKELLNLLTELQDKAFKLEKVRKKLLKDQEEVRLEIIETIAEGMSPVLARHEFDQLKIIIDKLS